MGNARNTTVYPPVKRDARISKADMEKSLVFVRKDAAGCRHELREFKMKLAELNAGMKKKKSSSKMSGNSGNTSSVKSLSQITK